MRIYADIAATTKMSKTAIQAMLPYMDEIYGNPSSLYSIGQKAKEALEDARERVAACLGCTAKEITFTSGGSEADNQAIVSAARLGAKKERSISFQSCRVILLCVFLLCIHLYDNPEVLV